MSALADITVRAPSTLTPVVHHLPLYHVLCAGVEKRLFAECFWRSAAPRSRLPKKLAKFLLSRWIDPRKHQRKRFPHNGEALLYVYLFIFYLLYKIFRFRSGTARPRQP